MARRRNGSTTAALKQRAVQIVGGYNILDLKHGIYKVESQSMKGLYYNVIFLNSWVCNCGYFVSGHGKCKHIIAVEILTINVDKIVPVDFLIQEPVIQCTKCESVNCVHSEDRHLQHGISPRYRCKDCGSKFTWRPGFLGRHYNAAVITGALEDRATGKSLAATVRSVAKNHNLGVKTAPDRSTILRWEDYVGKAGLKVTESIPIRVSGRWAVDEIYYKVSGNGRYLFGMMDTESRLMLANEVCLSDNKMGHNPTGMFERAIKIAGRIPQVLVSVSLNGFALAFKNTISKRRKKKKQKPIHIHSAAVQKRHLNNNMYERQNGTIRDRIKIVRGFNSEYPALLRLFMTYYNFIRPHMGLNNKTPAEAMGIQIDGADKWKTLLAFAAIC